MAWSPPLASVPPQPHCSVALSSWEQGTPSSLWSPDSRRGPGGLPWEEGPQALGQSMGGREGARGTSAPRSDVWAAFQRQQLMLVHSEEGPLTGERKATVRSGGKGNLVIAPPPSPGGGGWRIGETVTLSPSSVFPPPWGVGRSRCHQYFSF